MAKICLSDAVQVYGGSIIDVLTVTRVGQVGEDEKIGNMALGAARGLEYVHSKNCIHRDIAARNVLYTDTRIVRCSFFTNCCPGGPESLFIQACRDLFLIQKG